MRSLSVVLSGLSVLALVSGQLPTLPSLPSLPGVPPVPAVPDPTEVTPSNPFGSSSFTDILNAAIDAHNTGTDAVFAATDKLAQVAGNTQNHIVETFAGTAEGAANSLPLVGGPVQALVSLDRMLANGVRSGIEAGRQLWTQLLKTALGSSNSVVQPALRALASALDQAAQTVAPPQLPQP